MTRIVFSIFYRQNVCIVCFFCFGQNWNFSSMTAHWEQDFELRRCFTACHQAFRWNVSILLWIMRAWGRNVSKLTQCLLIFEFMVGGKNHGEKSCKWPGLGDLATIYRLWVAGLKIEDENGTTGRKMEENWQICFCLVEFITECLFLNFVMRCLQIFSSNIL